MALPIFLTIVHVAWMIYWGTTYTRIRKARNYAEGRQLADRNTRYKIIGYASFFTHNTIALCSFWSNAGWLLKIEDNPALKLAGVAVLVLGSILHAFALKHLGGNYSPCFDSHFPKELVTTGPYKYIRHPVYLAKLIVALGGFLMTGSLWALALLMWLLVEVLRSIAIEDRDLARTMAGYEAYKARTSRIIPLVF